MIELPEGKPAEIEFIDRAKPDQRGILPGILRDDTSQGLGFWFYTVTVPDNLGFGDPFRVDVVQKWINLTTVAEIRLLSPEALRSDLDQRRTLHEEVRQRMERG